MKKYILYFLLNLTCFNYSQENFIKKDTLFGSNTIYRQNWDVLKYDLTIEPIFKNKFIQGKNKILAKTTSNLTKIPIQIDLQEPMKITSIFIEGKKLKHYKKDDNFYFFEINTYQIKKDKTFELETNFEGKPQIAKNPPWDGGWIFTKDQQENQWMSVACQGIGASVWFPLKDLLSDEPDFGCVLNIIVPDDLMGVGNGKLIKTEQLDNQKKKYSWEVKNPINPYNIIPYVGKYAHFNDVFKGEKGDLNLDYWVLEANLGKAKKHSETKSMLSCFEYWFGAYPFYEDGYKLVESPYLGMEHQSNIAYGNKYKNGYLGEDLSQTGRGLDWDFIIIHESGHEWFGNNISNKDVADMWIHEGFTSYSETLYVESLHGKKAGSEYVIGTRKNILNDKPIIGKYGVHNEGSSDMYFKGANLIHIIRQLINNDELFRQILRGLNTEFYHKTVSTQEIENYIIEKSGINLQPIFNQYLRTNKIPILELKKENGILFHRYKNAVENFEMPLKIKDSQTWIYPTNEWKKSEIQTVFKVDDNFYIIQLTE